MKAEIPNFNGHYFIHSTGEVESVKNGKSRFLKQGLRGKDRAYKMVVLCLNGKMFVKSVHRLVAQAFIENPNNLEQVNHLDKNPINNNVGNLEWSTNRDNAFYSFGKQYSFLDPNGKETIIDDLPVFCEINGLSRPHMVSVSTGKRLHHRGWKKGK